MQETQTSDSGERRHNAVAGELRCESDRDLFRVLIDNQDVVRARNALERAQADNPDRTRRRLLASAVLLTPSMASDLYSKAGKCVEALGTSITPELYVYPGAQFNAACFKPEDGNLLVIFSSALLEHFTGAELTFVIGHELAHYAFHHHDLPVSYILQGSAHPDARLALDLYAWSRYAEISADRAGAYCAQDMDAVTLTLFKLASGLSGKTVTFNLSDLLGQVDQLLEEDAEPGNNAPKADWFATHPFSPLRVKALALYAESTLYRSPGTSARNLEIGVHALMSLMEPNYLEGKSEISEAMRRLLFAAALTVANADGVVSEEEIEIFERFFGKQAFSNSLNLELLSSELESRAENVRRLASAPQTIQVMRDLCIVCRAEGHTRAVERRVLDDVAHWLGISGAFVDQMLEGELDPD